MSGAFEWDGGKIEQGRTVAGTSYIIGSFKTGILDTDMSCEICGEELEEVSIKFVRLGAGELVTGGVEVTGWAWCPACREKRDNE